MRHAALALLSILILGAGQGSAARRVGTGQLEEVPATCYPSRSVRTGSIDVARRAGI
jgi:hypothetical protein